MAGEVASKITGQDVNLVGLEQVRVEPLIELLSSKPRCVAEESRELIEAQVVTTHSVLTGGVRGAYSFDCGVDIVLRLLSRPH
jgi:hypothetical protein